MNAARRSYARRDWPRGLREPRPGYYAWDAPDGTIMPIGRVPLAVAKAEAMSANLFVAERRWTLVDRLSGATRTVGDLIDKMPKAEKANTAKASRNLDKIIREALGDKAAGALSTADCAELIEHCAETRGARTSQAVRARLVALGRRGMSIGWMKSNPAEATERPRVAVKRGRLTLDMFCAIHAKAGEAAEWLPQLLRLALLTGADRSSLAALTRDSVRDGLLTIARPKTGVRIAIPLALRLDVLGWTLADAVAHRSGVVSRYLVHHVREYGNAPAGSQVWIDTMSKAFLRARRAAGIPDVLPDGRGAPTLHEVRSLAKRLYAEQGGVDTKALLGHATDSSAALYADPRGSEAIKVRIA